MLCSDEFHCRSLLLRHVDEKHLDDRGNFKCSKTDCRKSYKSLRTLSWHLKQHSEKSFKCDYCNFKTIFKTSIQRHVKMHTAKPRNGFVCKRCGKRFLSKQNFIFHKNKNLKKCVYCIEDFRCESRLNKLLKLKHEAWKANLPCATCLKSFKKFKIIKIHQKRKYQGKCPSNFLKKERCDLCVKSFTNRSSFLRHVKTVHGFIENRVCNICSVTFKSAKNLKFHLVNHKNLQTYQCSVCCFTTQYKNSLITHSKQHHIQQISQWR